MLNKEKKMLVILKKLIHRLRYTVTMFIRVTSTTRRESYFCLHCRTAKSTTIRVNSGMQTVFCPSTVNIGQYYNNYYNISNSNNNSHIYVHLIHACLVLLPPLLVSPNVVFRKNVLFVCKPSMDK